MNCILTEELRKETYEAFKRLGGQTEAARHFGVTKQYVWQVLTGKSESDDMLMKLSQFILDKIEEERQKDVQKKQITAAIRESLAA